VLAALRLLRAALDRDAELVAAIRAATHSGGCAITFKLLAWLQLGIWWCQACIAASLHFTRVLPAPCQ